MITKKFADFIVSLQYDKIPPEVIEKAKTCFLDFLGVSLRGSREKSGILALKALKSLLSFGGGSTIIGHGRASPLIASFINGLFAHSLDLDDGHRKAHLHPGACVIPGALALAERKSLDGEDFLTSIIVGYEVGISLGIMVNPEHRNKGFHTTGTCGTIAAAAAAAKILNLNKKETLNSLGLAGTQCAGLLESDHSGSMGKHLHPGRAAQAGILSTTLAKRGFTGADTIIEGPEGFLSAMGPDNDPESRSSILGDFHIKDVYLKKYPVCRHIHSSLDSAAKIIKIIGEPLKEEKVDEIIVKTYNIAAEHDDYNPYNLGSLRQSLPFSIALLFMKGDLGLEDLKDFRKARKFAKKIKIQRDEELEALHPHKRPSKVILKLKNEKFESLTLLPHGEPENPFTEQQILGKFGILNPGYEIKRLKIITRMESLNMDDLMDKLELGGNLNGGK